jgi:hypothetical protein
MTAVTLHLEKSVTSLSRGHRRTSENTVHIRSFKEYTVFIDMLIETKAQVRLNVGSFRAANSFALDIFNLQLPLPLIETFPQGYIAFTWRKERTGILNVAFIGKGMASYVAYIGENEEPIKGQFHYKSPPEEIFALIKRIMQA